MRRRGEVLAYIAGVVDNQATLFIKPHKQSQYILSMVIYHKQKDILNSIENLFQAGKIYPDKKAYQLRFGANDTVSILKQLLPYLRVKREQAELAIEFQTKKQHQRPLSDEERERRKQFYHAMKELKKR